MRLIRAVLRALHPNAFEQPRTLGYFNSFLIASIPAVPALGFPCLPLMKMHAQGHLSSNRHQDLNSLILQLPI